MNRLAFTRNFCIIAHIDHGKSTLADQLLLQTGAISPRQFRDQLLDDNELERERGITIRAHVVTMRYRPAGGPEYRLNLIDTPGHVDFSYEVSRSIAACEGALLVVDAAQGVEAQTVANVHLALKEGIEVIPVINKIDLPSADIDAVRRQIEDILAIPAEDALLVSAKEGRGIAGLLEAVVRRVPLPAPPKDHHTRALVFGSHYDEFRGVVSYVRLFSGRLSTGCVARLMSTRRDFEIREVGVFLPKQSPLRELETGDVGYVVGNLKDLSEVRVGETITESRSPAPDALQGFAPVHPMVFTGIYPVNTDDYDRLQAGLAKLRLNDPAFVYQAESSAALGFGFRCGFLGLLHMEIAQERLRREFDLDLIATYPSVVYLIRLRDGAEIEIDNPVHLPDPTYIERIDEPCVRAYIICPNERTGDMLQLVMEKRGVTTRTESLDGARLILTCELPLNEILVDFHDRIKSLTRGFGSVDYEPIGYRPGDLVKLDLLVNGQPVDAFSSIVHRSKAEGRGRAVCKALKEIVPHQLFQVAIQAAIGGHVIARETVRALRKDVTAKCYGGDITRKRKLLERQKEGKKRMKQVGKVNIPQEAFVSVLKTL